MSDVFDKILEKLPPSTIRCLSNLNNDSLERTTKVHNLLHEFENVKIRRFNGDLKRKISDLQFKTAENRNYLSKIKKELEVTKNLKKTPINDQSVRPYITKIKELEDSLSILTKDQNNIDLTYLFNNIEELNEQVEDYKKKISEAKSKYQSYDGFPPDVEEGREVIAKMKERIKQNKAAIESLFSS